MVPYVLLVVPLVPYLLSQNPSAGAIGITAGLAVASAAWYTWSVILHPGWIESQPLMRSFVVIEDVFIALLTLRSPWYAFFTWLGFLQPYGFLKDAWRW